MSRRVMKTTATATNTFLYDGWNLLAEVRDQSSEVSANYYVWGLDISQSLQGAGGILADFRPPTSDLHFYHYDGNGNVMTVTDSEAAVVSRLEYDPFGRVLLADGAYTPRFQFSSKEYDQATGLNYYGYRYLSPELGRWINRDPIGEIGGINLYAFVLNDPVSIIDPVGLVNTKWKNVEVKYDRNWGGSTHAEWSTPVCSPSRVWFSGGCYALRCRFVVQPVIRLADQGSRFWTTTNFAPVDPSIRQAWIANPTFEKRAPLILFHEQKHVADLRVWYTQTVAMLEREESQVCANKSECETREIAIDAQVQLSYKRAVQESQNRHD